MSNLIESLNWRYAAKRMNGQRVPEEKVHTILEGARLAPTANGIQPFSIVAIKDPLLLEKIKPIANNQPQVTEASHLLVFATWDQVTPERIDRVHDQIARERDLSPEAVKATVERLKTRFAGMSPEAQFQWAVRQTYIAFGVAIAAAAEERVDATPMEGFRSAELDKFLGLREKGLRSMCILALGYRDAANDKLAHLKKVRRPKDELVIELNNL